MRTCPMCNGKLYNNYWSDEIGLEETIEECRNQRCGKYLNHWSYGEQRLKLGDFYATFTDHGYMKQKDINLAIHYWKMFYRRVNYYRKRRK